MIEFMLLIRNEIGQHESMSPDEERQFLEKCRIYIDDLKNKGQLIAAQPMARQGVMLSGTKGDWKTGPFYEDREVIVGYYHILAKDLEEAVAVAKGNPEFEYSTTARVEVRPVKMKETTTGYVYPKK